ncbi:MAG: hypothetical protein U0359_20350 [Byssovorax sp.]
MMRAAPAPRKVRGGPRPVVARGGEGLANDDEDDLPDFTRSFESTRFPDPEVRTGGREDVVKALLQMLGQYEGLLQRYQRDFDEVFEKRAAGLPEDDDETVARLRKAQAVLVKYPVASQAAFAALVREGRQFAKTEKGKRLKRQLGRSPMLAKARTLFEGLSRGMVSTQGGALPSSYVDGFVRSLDRALEEVLAEAGGVGDVSGVEDEE